MNSTRRLLVIALLIAVCATLAVAQTAAPAQKKLPQNKPTAAPSATSAPTPTKPTTNAPVPSSWKQVPIPKLPEWNPKQPTRVELPNGMIVFLQEDHELPLIEASMRIRGGSRSEPAQKVGLVDIYGDVWRTGGTTNKTGDQMDDFLEARAAKIETGGTLDSTLISFSCLKQDFDDVFKLFTELLRDPAFREDKIALAKNQMNTMISRRNDDSGSIAAREAAFLVYGKTSPYARIAEYSTVSAITRDDLVNWHKQYVHPNNVIFGITGDFDAKQMEARLRDAFASWQKGPEAPRKVEVAITQAKPAIYVANKEDVNQSEIRIVAPGIERSNPDYFAVTVMNELFGGGFSSRLFTNLRTKKGLAYSVGGGIGAGWDHPGMLVLSIGTKSSTTSEAIQGLMAEAKDLTTNPPTEEELKRAKDSILNGFVFNFDSPSKVMFEKMRYEFYGYPLDFLERFRTEVEKVTNADVSRVSKKYVHPAQFATLVVGNAAEFDNQLAQLGPVTPLDITIPTGSEQAGKPENATPKPTASNEEGKQLIAKVVQFLGGEAKLQTVKALAYKGTSNRRMPQGEVPVPMTGTIVYPDRMAVIFNFGGQEIRNVVTPQAGFALMGDNARDMPVPIREDSVKAIKRDVVNVAQHATDPKYIFVAGGQEKTLDRNAVVLDIYGDLGELRWFVDPATGEVLRSTAMSFGPTGPVRRITDYSGWKDVSGLKLYTNRKVNEANQDILTDTIDEWTINPQVDPKLFEKPAAQAAK